MCSFILCDVCVSYGVSKPVRRVADGLPAGADPPSLVDGLGAADLPQDGPARQLAADGRSLQLDPRPSTEKGARWLFSRTLV